MVGFSFRFGWAARWLTPAVAAAPMTAPAMAPASGSMPTPPTTPTPADHPSRNGSHFFVNRPGSGGAPEHLHYLR